METGGFRPLLKNKNFMLLWGEQILSQFAYNLVNFALLIWVFRLTNSSFAESLLILSFILPSALFGVFTGVIADLFDRRKIMLTVHIIWAVLALSFIFIRDNFVLILIFSFILNTIDRFFTPAEQASLPNIVGKEDLLIANSFFSFSLNAGFLLGFSLAGPLMLLFGNDLPFYLASIFITIGLVFIYFLPKLRPFNSQAILSLSYIVPETIKQVKHGYQFVRGTKTILLAIGIFSILQIGMNTAMALTPSYVVNTLGFTDPKHASWVVMFPVGLGSVLAIILLRFWENDLKRFLIERGILIAGLGLLGLGLTSLIRLSLTNWNFYPLIFIFCLLLGLSVALILVPSMTIISQQTPNEYLGRVWGVANLIQNTSASIPLLLAGALADRISVLPLIFVVAIICIIMYTLSKSALKSVFFTTNPR